MKKILLVLLLVAGTAQAFDFGNALKKTFTNRWVVLGLLETAIWFDQKSTLRCVDAGVCHEGNPLLLALGADPTTKLGRDRFNAVKVGQMAGIALTDWGIHRSKNQAFIAGWKAGELTFTGAQAYVDYHNWGLIKK